MVISSNRPNLPVAKPSLSIDLLPKHPFLSISMDVYLSGSDFILKRSFVSLYDNSCVPTVAYLYKSPIVGICPVKMNESSSSRSLYLSSGILSIFIKSVTDPQLNITPLSSVIFATLSGTVFVSEMPGKI